MSQTLSPSSARCYGLARVARVRQLEAENARPPPTPGLVQEARIGAQLRLAAHRMMEAQIDSGLRHQRRARHCRRGRKLVGMVVFCPFHRLDPAVVAIAAPHDAGLRPMGAGAWSHA